MEKRLLGRTGIEASRLAFGGIITTDELQSDADKYTAYAVENGINYFDVAPIYGDAQDKLGAALQPFRKSVYLACKTAERKEAQATAQLHESLKKLKTDYFDNYQLHSLSTFEELEIAFAAGGVIETMIKAKKDGYIKNISFTSHDEDVSLKLLELFDFQTVLFPFNWSLGLGKNKGERLIKACKEKNVGVIGIKSLAHRGWREGEAKVFPKCWYKPIFSDEKFMLAALKYTLSTGVDLIVPPGYFELFEFTLKHFDECLKNPLNDEDKAYLNIKLKEIGNDYIM